MKKHIALALTSTFIASAATADSYDANEAFSPAQLEMITASYDEAPRVIVTLDAPSYDPTEAFSPAQMIMIKSIFEQADRDCCETGGV